MKKTLLILLCIILAKTSLADHLTGGEMYYTLTSQNGNIFTYHVVLTLYRDCDAPQTSAQLEPTAAIAIFNTATRAMVWNNSVPKLIQDTIKIGTLNPCIVNQPNVCYHRARYEFDVSLPGVPDGYTIAFQRCCRIAGINNLVGSNSTGATYTAKIPGTSLAVTPAGPANNSARFVGADTVITCANNPFTYSFAAIDPDEGDSLVYNFCNAYTSQQNPPAPNPPVAPNIGGSYNSVLYNPPYSMTAPLGTAVTINPATGLVSGIAPPPGVYVVTVCVSEFRDGQLIAVQRKDLQIKVGDCNTVKASLPSSYPICDDLSRGFENLSPASPLVHSWNWSFGSVGSSTLPTPNFTFPDTGTYVITLVVNRGEPCSDSATTLAHVYPGFFPGFDFAGICVNKPTQFFDTTKTAYGFVNSWRWDFGDLQTNADTSRLQNPAYTYSQTGNKNVRLIVTSSKGCIDTVSAPVPILDKPPVNIIPQDTLICIGDNVQLQAIGTGTFSWSGPNINSGGSSATPVVSPTATSDYIVTLNDNGCINTDTARVRVISFVTLRDMPDTVICATDSVQLRIVSDGLRFNWTPAASLNNPTLQNPTAIPTANTTYQVTATVGSCNTTQNITVAIVPYPAANAGPDTIICFDTPAQINASITGSAFTWTPASGLSSTTVLNPIARPRSTTSYILAVTDVLGCPKPKRDTILVTVLPKVNAFAGRDTAVVVGQPLQFQASGGIGYLWSPSTGLSNINIDDPVGTYDGNIDSIRYKVIVRDQAGCADSAYVSVKIFKTNPEIFVPSAFTPNGDGVNDVFRPIAVGISKFDYFRVYNRWGQLVFSTTMNKVGWDGRISGKEQSTGTFVWVVQGTDYTGKRVFGKGTVTLIR